MAIHIEETRTMGAGHAKSLDQGAINMILDNLQKSQYAYPFKSTTREIVCNAIDSIQERNVARLILTGKNKVEDFFVQLEGEVYKDSKFDPDYYDLKWLNTDDTVEIRYVVGGALGKDRLVIRDNGVGLGAKRLIGYFNLGFSSKRLSKLPVGKFGIGGKAPLSTGAAFFTMESNYNGQKFKFNVYSSTFDSIVPALNLAAGRENEHIIFPGDTPAQDYKVYWEPTTELNGVTITIETKKHHKQQYIDAVKSQLLYFENLKFIIEEDDIDTVVDYRANILYEDDFIVLSDNQYFSKPHLLLNKVNYGYIQWDELELEERIGNIGIKVDPDDIDVNPSRESVTWTDRTKQKILERFKQVTDIATRLINDELQETDFLKWIKACYAVASRYRNNGVLDRLAKIVDLSSAKIKYHKDPRIEFLQSDLLNGLYARVVTMVKEQRANKYKNIVKRKEIKFLGDYIGLPVFLMDKDEVASNRKDKWLLSFYPEGFLAIYAPFLTEEEMKLAGMSDERIEEIKVFRAKRYGDGKYASVSDTFKYISESQGVLTYSKVEVPEDFKGTEAEEEEKIAETEEEKEEIKIAAIAANERRKLEGKILVYTPEAIEWTGHDKAAYTNRAAYNSKKIEIPIKDINDWNSQEIYYARNGEDEMLQFVAMLTRDTYENNEIGHPHRWTHKNAPVTSTNNRPSQFDEVENWISKKWYRLNKSKLDDYKLDIWGYYNCQHFFDNKEIMLVKTAENNLKYLRDFKPIQEFFIRIQNKKITMSNLLIQWNTARVIKDKLQQCSFLYNFDIFNSKYAEMYQTLTRYVDRHYREVAGSVEHNYFGLNRDNYDDLITHLDNVANFQQFVTQNPDSPDIAILAMQLFGNRELTDGMALDPEIIEIMNQVLEFTQSCGTLLNEIPLLTGYMGRPQVYVKGAVRMPQTSISEQLEQEIKQYLEHKGVLCYEEITSMDEVAVASVIQVENNSGSEPEQPNKATGENAGAAMVVH